MTLYALLCAATWSQPAAAQIQAEHAALLIARDTLQQLQAAAMALHESLERHDRAMYFAKFERPMARLQRQWLGGYRSQGLTDKILATYSGCQSAVMDLYDYGRAMVRDVELDRASYMLRRYRQNFADCRVSINTPRRSGS